MKILIVNDTYFPDVNGSSYFAQRLAQYLQALGHEIFVIAPSRKFSDEMFEHDGVKILGVRSMPVERIRVAIPVTSTPAVKKFVQQVMPDVVHIQGHFSLSRKAARFARELGIPVVGTNHFMPDNLIPFMPIPKSWQEKVKTVAWNHFLNIFNKLDIVTTPTETAAKLIRDINIKHPVHVISNGIDLKRFHGQNNGNYLREKYHLADKPILFSVSRLDKDKNLDQVLRALTKAVQQVDIQFVIAGVGAEKNSLIALVDELGLKAHVTFVGFVPDEDLPNFYAISTCFVAAGTAELQGIAIMEAMATGLPIIAVDSMAVPELVRDGQNGFLFQHEDVNAMAKHIVAIFSDKQLLESMSEKSLEIIAQHDISIMMQKFVALYEQAIVNKKSVIKT